MGDDEALVVEFDAGVPAHHVNYLAQRLTHHERITIHPRSELSQVHGTGRLTGVTWRDHTQDRDVRLDAAAVFVLIGAKPCTGTLLVLVEPTRVYGS